MQCYVNFTSLENLQYTCKILLSFTKTWVNPRTKKASKGPKAVQSADTLPHPFAESRLQRARFQAASLQHAPPTTRGLHKALAAFHAGERLLLRLGSACACEGRGPWWPAAPPARAPPPPEPVPEPTDPSPCRSLRFPPPAPAFSRWGWSPTSLSPRVTACRGISGPLSSARLCSAEAPGP